MGAAVQIGDIANFVKRGPPRANRRGDASARIFSQKPGVQAMRACPIRVVESSA
jgi:hypothetical protein